MDFSQFKSKTFWGGVLIALSSLPQLSEFAPYLQAAGIALGGAGVAHKLDKIKKATDLNTKVMTEELPAVRPSQSMPRRGD